MNTISIKVNPGISYNDKIKALVHEHRLFFFMNPGGGQFVGNGDMRGFNCQVWLYDDKEDYEKLQKELNLYLSTKKTCFKY